MKPKPELRPQVKKDLVEKYSTGTTGTSAAAEDSLPLVKGRHSQADMKKKKKQDQIKLEEFANTRHQFTQLSKKTHFTVEQVEALIRIYKRLTSLGKMDRMRFRATLYSTFDITEDVILDRIFAVFDGDVQGNVSDTEWVLGMSSLLRGNLDEQIALCYEVYDINGDRGITRDEVDQFLQNCISPIPDDRFIPGIEHEEVAEACREVADIAMKKLDFDHNGTISYRDFYNAVNADPLLLEALGPCLPTTSRIKTFLSIFADDYWNYSTHLSHPNDSAWDCERDKFNRKKEIVELKSRNVSGSGRIDHSRAKGLASFVAEKKATLLTHREWKKMGVQRNTMEVLTKPSSKTRNLKSSGIVSTSSKH